MSILLYMHNKLLTYVILCTYVCELHEKSLKTQYLINALQLIDYLNFLQLLRIMISVIIVNRTALVRTYV